MFTARISVQLWTDHMGERVVLLAIRAHLSHGSPPIQPRTSLRFRTSTGTLPSSTVTSMHWVPSISSLRGRLGASASTEWSFQRTARGFISLWTKLSGNMTPFNSSSRARWHSLQPGPLQGATFFRRRQFGPHPRDQRRRFGFHRRGQHGYQRVEIRSLWTLLRSGVSIAG